MKELDKLMEWVKGNGYRKVASEGTDIGYRVTLLEGVNVDDEGPASRGCSFKR